MRRLPNRTHVLSVYSVRGSRLDKRTGSLRTDPCAHIPPTNAIESAGLPHWRVHFESLWENGVTTSLRGGSREPLTGAVWQALRVKAWEELRGGGWRELWEELEKSSGRNAAKFVADEARGRRAGK
jgi:hypothetical protein